jgi:hypothetical protein
MRLLKFVLVLTFVALVGWLAVRTVSVQSTDESLQITIDKRKLREAGDELKTRGRRVANQLGHTLTEAGRQLDGEKPDARR